MRSYSGLVGEVQLDAACPPRAPLTIARVVLLTAGSADACPTNDHDEHGGLEPAAQNSWVVLDMPIEISMYRPLALGLPFTSSGWIAFAWLIPAVRCAAGIALPPW